MCMIYTNGVDVYDVPSLKKNQSIRTITFPCCVKPNNEVHWVGVSTKNRTLLLTTGG